MSNDAGMTYNSGTTVGNNISLNRGVDMRTMPTDEIASVEIQQGIPSVEYGDLTSGLIKIKRKEGGRNLEARFKADLGSQLLYVGKGFEWGAPADLLTMNVGATWLNSHDDPRNTRQNYQRATGSWRMKKRWESTSAYRYTLGGSLDYTGSFDRQKSDRDIDEGPAGIPLERYKSSYNNVVAAVNFTAESKGANFFRSFDFSASVSSEFDLIDRWRYRANSGNVPIRTAVEEGVFDMEVLPVRYEATLQVDNKPFYANAKAVALLGADTPLSRNTIRIGAEWNMSKNYGGGLLYDVTRPFTDLMSSHPRRYDALPALHRLSAFLEDNTTITAGEWRIEIMAGLRTTAMANLGSRYTLQGKFHFDPRANLSVTLPAFDMAGDPMRITFAGGAGWHTKTPTLDQLFPEPDYSYYTRLNYFPADDESKRRVNVEVFKHDPTNYDLKAARNFKWEVRGNAEWNGYGLSVTYFRENMTSGFRTSTDVLTRTYREYDTGPLKDMEFTGPPQLEWLPYKDKTVFQTVGVKTNGSRTFKQGIEFSLSTRRIRALATKLIVSGAYFKTRYENSRTPVRPDDRTARRRDALSLHRALRSGRQHVSRSMQHQFPARHPDSQTGADFLHVVPMPVVFRHEGRMVQSCADQLPRPAVTGTSVYGRVGSRRYFAAYDPRQRIERSLSLPSHAFQYERQSQNLETALPRPAQHCDFRKPAVHIQSFVQKRDQRTGTPLFQPLFRHGTQLQTVMR